MKVRPCPRPRRRTGRRNIPRAPNPYVKVPPTHPTLLQGELPTTTATSPCCSVVSSPTPTLSTPHPHYLHPFTIAIIDSGGVALHHHIFGQPLPPPPKMSRFNIPRLRLYTGRRHGPRAANLHQLPHLTCGTRHQPRAPNQFTGSLGTVWFGGLLLCLADDCFSAEHWISWVFGYLGFCIACLVSWVSSHMPLFPFHGYAINRGGVLPL